MNDWLTELSERARQGELCALVTVVDTKGSTPREVGAKMLVTRDASVGSVGGGHLEYKAMEIARELLASGSDARATLRRFPLGPSLGQCCGGVAVLLFEPVAAARAGWVRTLMKLRRNQVSAVLVSRTDALAGDEKLVLTVAECYGGLGDEHLEREAVSMAGALTNAGAELRSIGTQGDQGPTLVFEPVRASAFHILLFGAGHVGRALVQVLQGLPCTVRWLDSRETQFPRDPPVNVTAQPSDAPEYEVDEAPPGSYFLVMTHNHALDQAICERILRRRDFRYCGLIGSTSKRRKFERRLFARGVSKEALARLTCPIGIEGISGKQPGEIAVAVAAELLRVHERAGTAKFETADTTR